MLLYAKLKRVLKGHQPHFCRDAYLAPIFKSHRATCQGTQQDLWIKFHWYPHYWSIFTLYRSWENWLFPFSWIRKTNWSLIGISTWQVSSKSYSLPWIPPQTSFKSIASKYWPCQHPIIRYHIFWHTTCIFPPLKIRVCVVSSELDFMSRIEAPCCNPCLTVKQLWYYSSGT